MRKYYSDALLSTFQQEYNSAVQREAKYMFHSMQRTAESSAYEFDVFFDDVISKMQQMKWKGE